MTALSKADTSSVDSIPQIPQGLTSRRIRLEIKSGDATVHGACGADEPSASDWMNLVDHHTAVGAQHTVCLRAVAVPAQGVTLDHDEVLVCLRARNIHVQVEDVTEISLHALLKIGHRFEFSSPALPFSMSAVLADEDCLQS